LRVQDFFYVHHATHTHTHTGTGNKLGKTSDGTGGAGEMVWLSAERTSVFELYQYWQRVSDADAWRFVRTLMFLPESELRDWVHAHTQHAERREAEQLLALLLTLLVYGPL
jgi:tyrosyl-tRNA synthetase